MGVAKLLWPCKVVGFEFGGGRDTPVKDECTSHTFQKTTKEGLQVLLFLYVPK
jgi:hypothetical protein